MANVDTSRERWSTSRARWLDEDWGDDNDLFEFVDAVLDERDELRKACELALRLPDWAIMSEVSSSSHYHSERRADEYDQKVVDALAKIREALARPRSTKEGAVRAQKGGDDG